MSQYLDVCVLFDEIIMLVSICLCVCVECFAELNTLLSGVVFRQWIGESLLI